MSKIKKIKVAAGVYWVEVKEVDLYILCGCPADAVKLMKKRGLIEDLSSSNGTVYESGPNVILLSDVLIQNGKFSNLIEFPVMQMLYLQGMLIPGHPGNIGIKPLIMGSADQIKGQLDYIYYGNYGLTSVEEIMQSGVSEETAKLYMEIKLHFAFGKINPSDELLSKLEVAKEKVMIRNEVYLQRTALNCFEFEYQNEKVVVDLNLGPDEDYEAPYQLGFHQIKREYFSVVHSGEGDGWDIHRPCMASILIFQGKIYLIDAGPNILASLTYLGISVNEIEGIFHTHCHDDHFAGLTTLIRTDHQIKYFASKLVRTSVSRKLCALMRITEDQFNNFFEIHDLEFDVWNNIDGLEIMPFYTPHPVETNAYCFRTRWKNTYKTYTHLADTTSFKVLSKMLEAERISQKFYYEIVHKYLSAADLKKIDIGGGLIHGDAEDYRNDASEKIVLAHTHTPLTMAQREIGSSAAFGMVDVLIPGSHDYLPDIAKSHLKFYFPEAPLCDINYLLNHSFETFNAGSILCKKGQPQDTVYLVITGSVEFTDANRSLKQTLPAGSFIGFYNGYRDQPAQHTYWAASNINVLGIPAYAYRDFISRNDLFSELRRLEENIVFLEKTWLFGEVVSFPILTKFAQVMEKVVFPEDEDLLYRDWSFLYLIESGQVEMQLRQGKSLILKAGDFFGGTSLLSGNSHSFELKTLQDTACYAIPAWHTIEVPVVHWKILETSERRLRLVI
jgi:hemerythrin